MKRYFTLLIALVTVLAVFGLPASSLATDQILKAPGIRVEIDQLRWNTGSGATIDTLIGAAARDTSRQIDVTNLRTMSAVLVHSISQGTAAGTWSDSVFMELSIDGTNWFTPSTMPSFTTASSASLGTLQRVFYTTALTDSVLSGSPVASTTAQSQLQGARWARFIAAHAAGAADTTFLQLDVLVDKNPLKY